MRWMKLILSCVLAISLAACNAVPAQTTAAATNAAATTAAETPADTPAATETPAQSASASASATASAAPTQSAAATLDTLSSLPDPALWPASLKLKPEEFPVVDGSTATIPLAIYARAKITGQSLQDCSDLTTFTTTGPSYLALAEGAADVLIVYEAPDEIKAQLKGMQKLKMAPIGLDALVFLTNEGNPAGSLTHQQIKDIYTGKIKNWKAVGGEDNQIIPYQRVSNSGSQALMKKLLMKDTPMMDAPSMLKPGEMGELIDQLAQYSNTKNALGYSVYYYVRNMYKVPGIKLMAVNGVQPSPETIASGQYPYLNPFYAVIRDNEPAGSPAHRLFDWLTGAEGAKAVADAGYVAAKK